MIREEQFNINDRVKVVANMGLSSEEDWSIGKYGIIEEITSHYDYPYRIKIENPIYDKGEEDMISCRKEELELANI